MPEQVSLTHLRQNLFKLVDHVIETGIPIEIERKGHRVKIILDEKKSKLGNLEKNDCIIGSPDELLDITWDDWTEADKL